MEAKNVALIIAGGVGMRMGASVPKQYLKVLGKPVIVYTMEAFENHPDFDSIAIVCQEDWKEELLKYKEQYNITKLKYLIPGGKLGQDSIRNGVFELEKHFAPNDFIFIHDAIRPLVSKEVLDRCISVAHEKGNAIVCLPCVTTMLLTKDQQMSEGAYPRDNIMETQTPQAFTLKTLGECHRLALEKGITNETASCALMTRLGIPVYFSEGEERNIKLTTKQDMDMMYALLSVKTGDWEKENEEDIKVITDKEIAAAFENEFRQYLQGNLAKPQKLPYIKNSFSEIGISNYLTATHDDPHYHTLVSETNFILSGHATLLNIKTKEEYELNEGSVFSIPPHIPHVLKVSDNTRIIFFKDHSINDKIPYCGDEEWLEDWYKR